MAKTVGTGGTGYTDEAAAAGEWLPLEVTEALVQEALCAVGNDVVVVRHGKRLFVGVKSASKPRTWFEVDTTYPQQSTVAKVLAGGTVVTSTKRLGGRTVGKTKQSDAQTTEEVAVS